MTITMTEIENHIKHEKSGITYYIDPADNLKEAKRRASKGRCYSGGTITLYHDGEVWERRFWQDLNNFGWDRWKAIHRTEKIDMKRIDIMSHTSNEMQARLLTIERSYTHAKIDKSNLAAIERWSVSAAEQCFTYPPKMRKLVALNIALFVLGAPNIFDKYYNNLKTASV